VFLNEQNKLFAYIAESVSGLVCLMRNQAARMNVSLLFAHDKAID